MDIDRGGLREPLGCETHSGEKCERWPESVRAMAGSRKEAAFSKELRKDVPDDVLRERF